MGIVGRRESKLSITVNGQSFVVRKIEIPFREGVELETDLNGERIRISDRQLGEHEAVALLKAELHRRLTG